MNHQQWAEIVQTLIDKIESEYPNSSNEVREKWKKQLKRIKQTCDELLMSWASVEDSVSKIFQQYPELDHEETDHIEEEFVLDEFSLKQFRQGQGYYQLAMFDLATPLLEHLVQSEPDFLLGRVFLGLCYYQQKKWDEANVHFDIITKVATSNEFTSFAYHMLGCIDLQNTKNERAIKQFTKALAILPENADSWFNLAVSHYQLNQYQEAIPVFVQVLNLKPDDWETMYYLSKCYSHLGQKDHATFWRLTALNKVTHPQVLVAIAHDYEEKGEYKKAIRSYDQILSQNRLDLSAYRGMAWNYYALRDYKRGRCWLKKGLSLFPKDSYLIFLHFCTLLQEEQIEQAKAVMGYLPNHLTMNSVWHLLLSRFYMQTGEPKRALIIAKQMIKQEKPAVAGLGYYQQGRIELENGETEKAVHSFQMAKKMLPSWKDPFFYEGVCHLLQKDPQQARGCWEKIQFQL